MRVAWLLLALALLLGACDDDTDDQHTAGGTASPPPTAAATGTPTVGIPEVDAIVRAVERRDADALVAIAQFETVRCIDEPRGIGAPPLCSSVGLPSGSTVEVLPHSVLHIEYITRADAPGTFRRWVDQDELTFYGMLRPDRPVYSFAPPYTGPVPEYAVVFRGRRRATPAAADFDYAFYLHNGRIVAVRQFVASITGPPAPDDPVWIGPPRQ